MRKRSLLVLAAALLVSLSAFADLTVDEIFAKNLEAKGGADKWKALKSVKFTGKMTLGPGMEAPISMSKKRPEMMRLDFTVQGMTGTQAYDGSTGWMLMPFLGKKEAEPMTADMQKDVKQMADFDGPTVDYKSKGHTAELVGKVDIEGTPAYKVKLVTKDGDTNFIYFDAESFLEIKTEGKTKIQGQEVESETTLGDYKEFDGLLFATSMEMKPKGAPSGQTITLEKVELNPTISDDTFKMPAKKAEAAPAETKKQ